MCGDENEGQAPTQRQKEKQKGEEKLQWKREVNVLREGRKLGMGEIQRVCGNEDEWEWKREDREG